MTTGPRRPVGPRRLIAIVAASVVLLAGLGIGVWVAAHPAETENAVAKKPSRSAPPPSTAPPTTPTAAPVPAIVVAAHRGGYERYPLETAPALLDAAKRPGVAVETDMRFTADGVAVLVHDPTVDEKTMSCTDGPKYPVIARTTWADLSAKCRTNASASPSGGRYGIPKVADLASELAKIEGAQWLLEIKTDLSAKQEAELFDLLEQQDLVERTVLTSFSGEVLAKARAEATSRGLTIRLMLFTQSERLSPSTAAKNGLWAVAVQGPVLTKGYVDALHGAELQAVAWTLNSTAEWQRADAAGVDFVVTDEWNGWQAWKAKQ